MNPFSSATKQRKPSTRSKIDSFSNLSQSTTVQMTKKNIESQQLNRYQPHSIKDNKYLFNLPYQTQISQIISLLSTKFSQQIIHIQEDYHGGKIIMNGIKSQNNIKKIFINLIDCLSIGCLDCLGIGCIRYGLNGGVIADTYNIVYVDIKKQILNNRCLITIQRQNTDHTSTQTFHKQFISKIQQELKKVQSHHTNTQQITHSSRYLTTDSLFLQQIQIKQKIFHIFIYQKDKKWQRFRRLFTKSQQNIKDKINEYKNKQQVNLANNKKNNKNPCCLIQSIIFESESLFRVLSNYYQKQVQDENDLIFFSSFLSSPVQKQLTIYCIEQIVSIGYFDQIIELYYQSTKDQCILFNKNSRTLNQNYPNDKYFQYLQLRDKFRLLELHHPYYPSISLLKTLPICSYPRELLLFIQCIFSSVKIDCLKSSKGKTQLSSMDDLLPVMIFVTARAQVQNFPLYVKIVDDYVKLKNIFELEERIITTLYVAVEDISKKSKF